MTRDGSDPLRSSRTRVRWTRVDPHGPGLHTPKLPGDIGWDLEAAEDITIRSGRYADVPTNVRLELPENMWAQILARSSIVKRGIMVDAGIIDTGYRGPLFVVVRNMKRTEPGRPKHSSDICLHKGERIAQLVFHHVEAVWAEEVQEIADSERGALGFGSTGR